MPYASRPRPLALAYVRVSTTDPVEHGGSLDVQRATLTAEAERRGWEVEIVADEGRSAKSIVGWLELVGALERLDAGEADFLLAVRLDRVSRSVADFAGLLDRAARRGWGLVLLSPIIDTAAPAGRFTANVLASAAQYERGLIGARTREGMMQRKAEGPPHRPAPHAARVGALPDRGRPRGRPLVRQDRRRPQRLVDPDCARRRALVSRDGPRRARALGGLGLLPSPRLQLRRLARSLGPKELLVRRTYPGRHASTSPTIHEREDEGEEPEHH